MYKEPHVDPPDTFFDDVTLDAETQFLANELARKLAGEAFGKVLAWITNEGKASKRQVNFRVDIVRFCLTPGVFECPSCVQIGNIHGVSKAYVSRMRYKMVDDLAPYIHLQFRGMRTKKRGATIPKPNAWVFDEKKSSPEKPKGTTSKPKKRAASPRL